MELAVKQMVKTINERIYKIDEAQNDDYRCECGIIVYYTASGYYDSHRYNCPAVLRQRRLVNKNTVSCHLCGIDIEVEDDDEEVPIECASHEFYRNHRWAMVA